MSRTVAWVLLVLAGLICVQVVPGPAQAAAEPVADGGCRSARAAGAKVRTSVRLEHDDTTYTKVVTELTVDLPGTWPPARDLLLGEDSRSYATAMACLTGVDRYDPNWHEQRSGNPVVTSKGGRVHVVHAAHGWIDDHRGHAAVGLWRIAPTAVDEWKVSLAPPDALLRARWDEITVDPGRPGVERAEPEPSAGDGATALVWRPGKVDQKRLTADGRPEQLAVTAVLRPPWHRSWAVWNGHLTAVGLDFLGTVLWASTVGFLLLTAVRRYRRRPGVPSAPHRPLGNLRTWAMAAIALQGLVVADGLTEAIVHQLLGQPDFGLQLVAEHTVALASVVVLFAVARPSRGVWLAAGVVALSPLAAIGFYGVDTATGVSKAVATDAYVDLEWAIARHVAVSFSLVALLLLAFAAAAWRLAVDGGLLPKSRRFPGRDRRFRLRVAGPTVLVFALAMAVCFALVEERNWQRAGWLMDRADHEFGAEHRWDFVWEAMWSVSYVADWLMNHGWWLTGLAVIAVLRTRHDSAVVSPLHDPADRIALLVFFPLVVGLDPQNHIDNALLEFLWTPLYMLALYGVTALLAHRSVLAQPFEISGRPLWTVAGPATRGRLLAKARSYREIHAELRRLDQGLFGDVPPRRDALERRLSKLHNWRVNSAPDAAPDRLPAKVSVVDAVLALGPRDDWWGNGVRGARFALVPGIPAAVLNTWSQWVRGEGWQNTLADLLGFADLLTTLVSWTATFAGAGLVLGALWRVLPGRRGAVKALPVAVAFALPVGLDVLMARLLDESSANVALYVSTMLFVLTVTAIALDLDTFSGERRYWQSRLGLLLSIYQMRYYSLQVAYLIGQVIAIITIWQFFAEPDAVPSGGEAPPTSNG
ncbi:DUF6185 family protein [Streptomyces sp. MB09-02B]|uniref:DUF6185 family protein n=1 Tax=Streptomyces sp. MB09-02B TaxID=3028667 RepID=UPI0029B1DBFC|nr:DUF6185 family protein [Streptomyces sp. MB09-02B]MDX3638339.1 DUF6185 family protein [Streptomyces sp. MB09-02B]